MDFEGKGLRSIFAAMAASRHASSRLLVLGTGPERRFRRLARDAGLEKRVIFAGRQSEIQRFYGAGDLFLLPTAYEPFPNVNLEAMACGLPVVTTDVGGNAEVVCDETLGTVVPFGDRERLTAALAAALDRQRLLGETARLADARRRLERLEALGALATETAHEIENALLAVHALLDSGDDGSSVGLRALCLRHLRQALDLSESLTALTAADASAPPAPVH
jgi:glycosyltransferase involved in cell wall biosynthesis